MYEITLSKKSILIRAILSSIDQIAVNIKLDRVSVAEIFHLPKLRFGVAIVVEYELVSVKYFTPRWCIIAGPEIFENPLLIQNVQVRKTYI